MTERELGAQFTDWVVNQMSAEAEPSPVRDYYLTLLRQGRGVPEALGLAVDDLLEEVRTAVSRQEQYNPRAHRSRLGLPSFVPCQAQRLPRTALVRRIVQERLGMIHPQSSERGPRRHQPRSAER